LRLYVISCEALFREVSRAVALSPHVCDLSFLPFGLHDTPEKLRTEVQSRIDTASLDERYDHVVLAYGLCSRGTADLHARRLPIVIPKVHDCITLFLGSNERYQSEFGEHPGTYYYTSGWIERKEGDARQGGFEIVHDSRMEERYREYAEKFGEDNAQFLIEQEKGWLSHYNRAAFINTGLGDQEYYRRFTKHVADSKNWTCEEIPGDARLIDSLLAGEWNPDEFLIVQPGQRTAERVDAGIIVAL